MVIIAAALILMVVPMRADQEKSATAFLASGVNVNASTTAANGTDFTSVEIPVAEYPSFAAYGVIQVEFARAAGSASTVDFKFQISMDNATTWTWYNLEIDVPTNTTAVTGTTVRMAYPVQIHGVTNIRLAVIDNTDAANNVTACNAKIALGGK